MSENNFNNFMEEVKDEIKNAPKMFHQLQKRDELIKELKQQRNDLLDALRRDAFLADQAISATPTGDLRNKLTELNILRLTAIEEKENAKNRI